MVVGDATRMSAAEVATTAVGVTAAEDVATGAEAAVALASGLVAAAVVTEAIGAGALVGWSGATNNPPATRRSS